jgi:hypothetical protein
MVGPSDIQIMAGTLADLSARQIGNNELYWRLFKSHPWIRSCVTLIANSVAQEGYDIAPVDDTDDLNDNDPRLKDINEFFRVAFIGRFNTFRKIIKATVCDMQTYGVGYWRRKKGQQDGQKTIVALERMDARYVVPHLSQDKTEIDFYTLIPSKPEVAGTIAEAAQQMSAVNGIAGEQIPADEMIAFSVDDGGDAVMPSPSPLEALDLTAAMDMNVRKHRNSFFENGAQLGNVLIGKSVTDDQIRDAQKKLALHHVGARRAYKNIAIAGDWDIKSLMQQGKNELDFVKGTQIVIEEILAVYKVPEGKLRSIAGSMGQAGKGEDDETFEQECVLPIEECLYETLTLEILQKEFGIDDLRFVPARRNKLHLERFEAAVSGSKIGMTGNELRDLVGLPKSDVPGMDVPLFLGATKGDLAGDEPVDPADKLAAEAAASGGGAAPAGGKSPVTTQDEMKKDPSNTTIESGQGGRKTTAKGKDRAWY